MDGYLVRRDEISAMAGVRKTHFANPVARRVNRSLGDRTGLTGFGFHIIDVEPGCESTEHHLHYHEDECIYVLEGTATAFIGDDAFDIAPGDFIGYRKGGLAHSIRNTGEAVFRCIVVGARLPHDVADYPRLGRRIFRNVGLPWTITEMSALTELGPGVGKK